MKNKRQWIKGILNGEDVPTAQYWMSFFNADTARKLTPESCHFNGMSLYEAGEDFDMEGMSRDDLNRMIAFNDYTDRCFACLGKGAAVMFGHGGPGEFFCRTIEQNNKYKIVEYETGVKVKVNFQPHFYHSFDHPVKTADDLAKVELPDPDDPKRYQGLAENTEYLKSLNQYVVGSLNGFFSGLHYWLIDYQELLMAIITEPELVKKAAALIGEWNLAAAERMLKAGVDGLTICDDLGSKQNLLMAPQQYSAYFKLWHKKLCKLAHEYDATVSLHSHGAIHLLLGDLVECGFDFINPFDPEEGFDTEEILKNYSESFVVVGGFPGSFWYWSPEKQHLYLEEMATLGRKYKRFIFMDSSGVPEDISPANFKRVIKISKEFRKL